MCNCIISVVTFLSSHFLIQFLAGVRCGTGSAYSSGQNKITPRFFGGVRVAQSLSFLCCWYVDLFFIGIFSSPFFVAFVSLFSFGIVRLFLRALHNSDI